MWRRVIVLIVSLVMWAGPTLLHSAQSTKDITASAQMKENTLQTVLGDKVAKQKNENEYIVGHGDILSISVYGEGTMSAAAIGETSRGKDDDKATDSLRSKGGDGVQVRIDGRISLKHVGDVRAVGMTLTQLADYLKVLFATVYDDPVVTVVLLQSNSQRYTVMGKVAAPGIFYLDYPINLVQVIARSGGFTEWAKSEVTVVRKDTEEITADFEGNTLRFDYDDFLSGKKLEKNILIKAGDIVIVH